MSLIFGSLGFIIGHEITHGFDNTGRHFDKYGNLVEWWGNKSAQQFSALSQCFVDEYSDFIIYGHHANGVSTLGENIADNGGLRISYNAFRSLFEKQNFNDAVLPGLNMTVNQQFFLGFAQTWCSYYQPEYAIQLLVLDVHSNSRDRVNGVLRNMPEFTEAFNCKSTSPMNPPNKCSLW
jgi:predicted metalloendopeptidase